MAAAAAAPLDAASMQKLRDITQNESVDQQAMTFLRSFVVEFQGKFEEVLTLAESFKKFAENCKGKHVQELDEFEAHRFLEMRGAAKTVKDMRDELKAIDLDSNGHVAFIEYLLFSFKKTPQEMFASKPNDALIKKLEEAVRVYRAHFDKLSLREKEKDELVKRASAGDVKAKSELKRLETADPSEDTKSELDALQKKLAAKRALSNPEEESRRAFEAEQQRVADEKRAKEQEEAKARADSRKKLADRAALFK
jgi:hypothetical protein